MIPFFIYHPTEQTFKKVHHMPEIGDRKKNKTKSLTLMISQIIPYRTTWGSTPGFNNEKKKSQKKKKPLRYRCFILSRAHFKNKSKNS